MIGDLVTVMTNTTTHRISRLFAIALLALGSVVGMTATSSSPTKAWAWDPNVVLNGRVTCSPFIGTTPNWMWVSASNGEAGWAALSGSGVTRSYSFRFRRVPTSTMTVRVEYGCSNGSRSVTSFGLNRPASGITATRNICPSWWTGPCWI